MVTAEELLFILKLCDKVLIVESDINKLKQILGGVSINNLYRFLCELPLNTSKVKEAINKLRISQAKPQVKKFTSFNLGTGYMQQNKYKQLLNSATPKRS
jgi:hypothetical protein